MKIKDNAHFWVWLPDIPDDFAFCERCRVCVPVWDIVGDNSTIKKDAKKYTYKQAVELKKLKDKENELR